MSRSTIAIVLFLLGVGFLFPFEHTVTLILGVGFLIAFVIYGVFTIATPEFLADSDDEPAPAPLAVPVKNLGEEGSADG